MRPISRTALGAATAAVLAVTAVATTAAAAPRDTRSTAIGTGERPLVGSEAAARGGGRSEMGVPPAEGWGRPVWGDRTHHGEAGSFGDAGSLRLRKGDEVLGESAWPFGVFEVPSESAEYTLEQNVMKFGSKVWNRSTSVNSLWKFTSKLDENVYSQGIPILFPRYDLPEDGLKTLAATDGQHIGLGVTGHAGYTPAAIAAATLSYSYDGGTTWTAAQITHQGDAWTATVNHAGAGGKQGTLRTELTDAHGNSVTQTVVRAYDVR
ncbi:hypothetical protein [Streptomyces sp. NPDC051909]|uniref:hypothetical protein n=1 Tax=Streptomyces sp. NPDC051909 TaxID=3154944 RepID=UPI0034447A2E